MAPLPAAFIGHGTPMNTLEHNHFTDAWTTFGLLSDRPRAVLAISAHWYIDTAAVTSMANPPVIHDFYGFPQQLFDFDYPAPGAPDVAEQVAEIVKPVPVALDDTTWGIDHGTWSVLAHVFPAADIPVVQLSIDATQPLDYHIDLGRRLAPLLDDGIMILASGNIVHNLRAINWHAIDEGFDWAHRFDDDIRSQMADDPTGIGRLTGTADYRLAAPTPDHFLPLAYIGGVADARGASTSVLVDGCTMGSLSMTSYVVGA